MCQRNARTPRNLSPRAIERLDCQSTQLFFLLLLLLFLLLLRLLRLLLNNFHCWLDLACARRKDLIKETGSEVEGVFVSHAEREGRSQSGDVGNRGIT